MRFKDVVAAQIAASQFDQGSLSRLDYWVEAFADKELESITDDEVDLALVKLAQRGRVNAGLRSTKATGRPLKAPLSTAT